MKKNHKIMKKETKEQIKQGFYAIEIMLETRLKVMGGLMLAFSYIFLGGSPKM